MKIIYNNYDDWKTTPPEPTPLHFCERCYESLCAGDKAYLVDGEYYCEDCGKKLFLITVTEEDD